MLQADAIGVDQYSKGQLQLTALLEHLQHVRQGTQERPQVVVTYKRDGNKSDIKTKAQKQTRILLKVILGSSHFQKNNARDKSSPADKAC